jgi:hypothetical protein
MKLMKFCLTKKKEKIMTHFELQIFLEILFDHEILGVILTLPDE